LLNECLKKHKPMKVIATQKFYRMSPKKLRIVADVAKKLTPLKALDVLPFIDKHASSPLIKVIKTAIGNAKVRNLSAGGLEFSEIQIGEGPRLKRGRPVSRGRWHPFKRRTSHIRVILEAKNGTKN